MKDVKRIGDIYVEETADYLHLTIVIEHKALSATISRTHAEDLLQAISEYLLNVYNKESERIDNSKKELEKEYEKQLVYIKDRKDLSNSELEYQKHRATLMENKITEYENKLNRNFYLSDKLSEIIKILKQKEG
jgi:hypothetical protein